MKPKILIAAFVSSLLTQSSALGQGALTPPGAPAPTMKTLSQVEPRTPISSAPFTITTPGSYYLTTNLAVSSGDAIDINTSGVTLDLNGFTISSSSPTNSGYAISLNSANDVTILNGHIQSGVTNNGSGIYGGPGFKAGIDWIGAAPQNVRVSGVSVAGVLSYGIYVSTENMAPDTSLVEGCQVHTVGNLGIVASIVKSSSAMDCGLYAIGGDQILDCRGQATVPGGGGIYASYFVQNSYGYATNGSFNYGIISDGTALNCYGYSGPAGQGIYAQTAAHCYGYNGGSGCGVNAQNIENCYGTSTSGIAVSGLMVQNSEGETTSGMAIRADSAINCYAYVSAGVSGSYGINTVTAENCYSRNYGAGYGIYSSLAFNCCSLCTTGTGLYAFTANSCHATTYSGTAYNVTHNVNSY